MPVMEEPVSVSLFRSSLDPNPYPDLNPHETNTNPKHCSRKALTDFSSIRRGFGHIFVTVLLKTLSREIR